MEVILNEFSVVGQFASCDDFTDYMLDEMGEILDCMIEKKIPFLKRQDFYSSRITEELSLNDILLRANDPAVAAIRKYISDLAYHEPYWDREILSKNDVEYVYPAEGEEPNCFTEVIERNEALLQNGLDIKDIQNILLSIPQMIGSMVSGTKNDYWDSLRDGIFEFRIHVSGNRIFRLLFFQDKGIVFLNGFIKKSQKTPPGEIEKALKIKNALISNLAS